MTKVQFSQVQSLAPHMTDPYREAFNAPTVNKILTKYGIAKSPLRVCHFFAQVLTETAALSALQEDLDYSALQLMRTWPNRFPTIDVANEYAHDAEKLGDFVYGGRLGNANPGDGFLFRGRGLLQITGRAAYTRFGGQLGIALPDDPDLACGAANCIEIAAAEWAVSGHGGKLCNELADDDDIVGVTYAINGGRNGINDRKIWLQRAKDIWLAVAAAAPPPSSRAEANVSVASDAEMAAEAMADSMTPPAPGRAAIAAPPPAPRSFDPIAASLYGQFVQAAYTMYGSNVPTPQPSADFPAGYRLAAWINMQDFILQSLAPSFYGVIAQSNANPNQFVVAIRGTSNGVEWWDDINAATKTPFKNLNCGLVGAGFARIYDTLEVIEYQAPAPGAPPAQSLKPAGSFSQQITALVRRHAPVAAAAAPGAIPASATVEVTGHSLGAALATLYAMENARTDQLTNPALCTFASPLVGDATFAAAFNALGLTSWRIDNAPDLVTKVPPAILGFVHVDTVVPVNSAGKVKPLATCWHALSTYLSLIDPAKQPDQGCRLMAAAGLPWPPPPGGAGLPWPPPDNGPPRISQPSGAQPIKLPVKRKIARYGWKPDLPDQRDYSYSVPAGVMQAIPGVVDLRPQCPPVYDQGQIGSCTANAIAAALEFDMMKQGLPQFTPSRLFIYYNERSIEGTVGSDSGAFIRDGIKSVASQGDCPETLWPYDGTAAQQSGVFPPGAPAATQPNPQCYANAVLHKALTYQSIDQNLADMKGCLASGYPFVFGFTVYDSFESAQVAQSGILSMPGANEASIGGHAVLAVGYDDQAGRFLIRNSWGPNWGLAGYFYMPYAYLLDNNLSDDFWTIRVVGE